MTTEEAHDAVRLRGPKRLLLIGPAVALHEGSTLVVVVNALRLLAYREPAG